MDEIAMYARKSCVKERLYADNLVSFGDSWKKVQIKYAEIR